MNAAGWHLPYLFRRLMALLFIYMTGYSSNAQTKAPTLERLKYNHPGLLVDLAVGLGSWPLPMDYNNDGLIDLVVACADVPYDGLFLFQNTGKLDKQTKLPIFSKAKKLTEARKYLRADYRLDRAPNIRVSYIDGQPLLLTPGKAYPDFKNSFFEKPVELPIGKNFHGLPTREVRANQWEYIDFDGDGVRDLLIGIDDWADNRKGDYDAKGQWTGGPLHGYVYIAANKGSNEKPEYATPKKLTTTDGVVIDVYGWPSPVLADFTGDGKPDLLCGEFRDGFSFYKNVGTRTAPLYAPVRPLTRNDQRLVMDLCMSVPVAIDFNRDGFMDLMVGEEGGRVALIKHSGKVIDGMPQFEEPVFLKQEADEVKFGALSTPVGFDWDGDGKEDILAGNSEGQIAFIKNLGGKPVKWASPVLLKAGGATIRIEAGVNGSIQGPTEIKWGYTSLSVADWNGDGLPDILLNSIWGKVVWFENKGSRKVPLLKKAQPVEVEWKSAAPKPAGNWWNPVGKELVTQWRTNPVAIDWTGDGLTDLIMLDHEGYLALFRREKKNGALLLLPGERVFRLEGVDSLLRLNDKTGGGSGRRQLSVSDMDGDGRPDILLDGENAVIYKNTGTEKGITVFRNLGPVHTKILAGHSTSPTTIDSDGDKKREILVGAEDGFFYHLRQ